MDLLPLEIIQQILADLPDFESLQCMILTSRRFLEAFHDREKWVLCQILEQSIPRTLWFDAHVAFMASQLPLYQHWQARKQVMEFYLVRDVQTFHASFQPRLSHRLALSKFYRIVEHWSSVFASYTLRFYRIDGELRESPLDPVPVSDSEYIRIERDL
ncbi:uncharacterized protein N7496_003204 [Penicillium cataractarum]|uniref:F-box domain-containing protein n=1 Tax=Penicillium cataractarum TaxID=2100454 RepID=A0A9W9SLJ1_9EURO|nr:uncharacterized protein N7496_003204 [Penicillium cataractarum]KAJ5380776.1 hypothetical protein N7496_003204 [Penicillium cataractarum]